MIIVNIQGCLFTKRQHKRHFPQDVADRESSREELRVIQRFRPGASINKLNMRTLSADFPGGSDGKASTYNAGDPGSIPGLGKPSEEENGNPLQYSCLENPMDRGVW